MFQYHQETCFVNILLVISSRAYIIIPAPFRFRSNLYGVEKPFMQNWLTGMEASSFVSFIIKMSRIPFPIVLSSSNFETREFIFKVAIITFFILFILTFLSSVMHSVFNLDALFELEISFREIEHLSFAT